MFAYRPADAAAVPKPHNLLPHLNPNWVYLSGTGLLRLSRKSGRKTGAVVVAVVTHIRHPYFTNYSFTYFVKKHIHSQSWRWRS